MADINIITCEVIGSRIIPLHISLCSLLFATLYVFHSTPQVKLQLIHRVTVTQFRSSWFRRRLVGETLRNVCYSAVIKIRFVGRLMIMWTFS